ncbi:MAG: M20/M25/M40 family metallo-hydrolase [Candidatus Vogelbacteria bacterium]|nr:M20/M25/M40 family metallo-hydrolase [Candidatus Vogelbacteria bacterium]
MRQKILIWLFASFTASNVLGQTPPLPKFQQIKDLALQSDYAYKVTAHLSGNIGPRLSGSQNAECAVQYIADEMRRLGLVVQLEKITVPHWVRGIETGELTNFPGYVPKEKQRIILTAPGGSVATSDGGLTRQLLVVHSFKELETIDKRLIKNKIILFNVAGEYGQCVPYRVSGPSSAARFGASATLVRSVGIVSSKLPHTGITIYNPSAPRIPAAAVTSECAEIIENLAKKGPVTMHLVLTPKTFPDAVSYNVTGDLVGRERPEQIIIVSGHLDSWDLGTGTLDDAVGVAAALDTARILSHIKPRSKKTIRVVAWMGEEFGGVGGKQYTNNPTNDLKNHFAAIECDLGAEHPIELHAAGKPELLAWLNPIRATLQALGVGTLRLTNSTGGAGTDIEPLAQKGVPSFGIIQDKHFYFDYHHTAADTLDKVDPKELQSNVLVMSVLTYTLSEMQRPLPR